MTPDLKRSREMEEKIGGQTHSFTSCHVQRVTEGESDRGRWALCRQKGQHLQTPAFNVFEKYQGN